MAWRFRRSVTIVKGFKINYSNSGISYTTGFKGYTVTHTKNGTYRNMSIPILGIYSREKIRDKKTTKTISNVSPDTKVVMSINEKKEVVFKDLEGNLIVDESFIRKIKKTPEYKAEYERLSSEMTLHNIDAWLTWIKENDDFINIHKHAPKVLTRDEYIAEMDAMEPEKYIRETFGKVAPTKDSVRTYLENEAEQSITSYAFWKIKKLRQQYVEDNLPIEFERLQEAYYREKREFECHQDQIEQQTNEIFLYEYDIKRDYFSKIVNGFDDVIINEIDAWISDVTLPCEVHINYEYNMEAGHVLMDVEMPSMDDMPDTEITYSEDGSLGKRKKSSEKINQEYYTLVYGLGIFLAANIFNISPYINGILISACTQGKKEGLSAENKYVYSIKFTREVLEINDAAHYFSPYLFCIKNFETRGDYTLKEITPFFSMDE